MSILLLRENGTVTITHSRTKELKEVTGRADILVVAIGKPKFITADYVKEGAVVIDVGMHRNEENKLCGDVDFDDIKDKVSAITPGTRWSWSYDNRYADVQLCRSSEGSGGRVEHRDADAVVQRCRRARLDVKNVGQRYALYRITIL